MPDFGHLQAVVPGRAAAASKVIALARPASRTAPPTIRATAIVFEDPGSAAVKAELDRLGPSDASIVIHGETGTGKEIAARYLHENSPRRAGPFLAVNCGALVDTLVEAELFGYDKGAFTGALKTQPGWFEAAHGGTLLLDEIGDLPLALQVKLLRVLQEREVVRLGTRTPVPVDVRVIAATNVDLLAAVAAGRFRQDLFFRLNVASVTLPPLRDRPRDIGQLAEHFLLLYRDKMGRPELSLGADALTELGRYAWPGNIRELENVIHNAVVLAPGPVVTAGDLRLTSAGEASALPAAASLDDEVAALVRKYLARGEDKVFERVVGGVIAAGYENSERNQVRAADRLGISRNELRTHLARLGIIPPRTRRPSAAE